MANKNYTLMELEAIKKLCKSVNLIANLPTDLIADTNVATNTTYSSYRIDAEMSALENDIQRYVDTALAGLSRLTKEVIDDKALVVKENVLYLYKDPTDINNDYMQMMLINGVAIELGSTTCDFSSVYSKDESDDKFALKIDLDVLTTSFNDLVTSVEKKIDKDNIATVLDDTVTDEQVPSAKVVYEELDLKANDSEVVKKTDISTTIDSSSTDNTVPTTKAVYDKVNSVVVSQITTSFDSGTIEDYLETLTPNVDVLFVSNYTTGELVTLTKEHLFMIEYRKAGNGLYLQRAYQAKDGKLIACRSKNWWNTTWSKWQKVCTTSVADVPFTTLTVNNWATGDVRYAVKDGICYIWINALESSTMDTKSQTIVSNLPHPIRGGLWNNIVSSDCTKGGLLVTVTADGKLENYSGLNNTSYFGTFSYPVAE